MIVLPNKPGLRLWLESLGWSFRWRDGLPVDARNANGVSDDEALQAACDAYDPLPEVKKAKLATIKLEGLRRIQGLFPAIWDLDELKLVANIVQSIAPAARKLTLDMQAAVDVWQAAQDAIAAVKAAQTIVAVEDVSPAWPTF